MRSLAGEEPWRDRLAVIESSTGPRGASPVLAPEQYVDLYSAAWHQEAAKRGLLNMKTAVDSLPMLDAPEVKALFAKYNVLSERELKSRWIFTWSNTARPFAWKLANGGNGQDAVIPRRNSLPERIGLDLCQPEAGGLRVRYRHARQGDRTRESLARQRSAR